MLATINQTDLQSFLFYYSVWMVDNLTLTFPSNFSSFTLNVTFHEPTGDKCSHCYLGFMEHPGPALYQINRLAISMHSMFIHNTTFLDSITVNLPSQIPGIEGTTFSLRDFTQKEIFSAAGPTNTYICNDCKNYLPLTNSPEDCVDVDGNIVACADVTDLGSPFADLSYDTSLRVKYSECNKDETPWWFWVVVIVIPVVVATAIVGIIVFYFKRRARNAYQEIPTSPTNIDPKAKRLI